VSIDVETVATTLVLAEKHHCNDLKEAWIGSVYGITEHARRHHGNGWFQASDGELPFAHE
jgi:hypothetical protein